eukprot:TRINITY_DN538_c3_g1_i1.p1 TRINITY_DN538_c3_g1~~TRINITY_DN538_c3_g1_i1.p1  ORF type:complete len:414 (+),score=74.24 TRINITY_DN538_c3_g1_i1:60-1301(+)
MSLLVTVIAPTGESIPAAIEIRDTVNDVLKGCALELDVCPTFIDLSWEGEVLPRKMQILRVGVSDGAELILVESQKTIAIRKLGKTPTYDEMLQEIQSGEDRRRISLFLDTGIEPTVEALNEACANHNTSVAELLVELGVQQTKFSGHYPIHVARCTCTARLLLQNGADPDCFDDGGMAAIHCRSSLGVVKTLLEFNCDKNIKDVNSNTPIMSCYDYGPPDVAVAQELLKHDVDLDHRNKDGMTILHIVKDIETATLIIDKNPSLLDATTPSGNSPLHYCWGMRAAPAMTQLLVDKGASVNLQNSEGLTPLHYVENCESAQYLIDHGADLSIADNKGRTPLHSCFGDGEFWPSIALLYISLGSDIHAKDQEGYTLLHYVTDLTVAETLVEKGADVNVRSRTGLTPLMYHCMDW